MKSSKEFVRYILVGVATNGFGYLLYFLFTTLGVSPVLYISVSYSVHVGLGFYFNKKWSFTHEGQIAASAVRYLISYVVCYAMNVAAMKYFYGYWGISHMLVQAASMMVIAPLLFVAQKFWVFRENAVSFPPKSKMG